MNKKTVRRVLLAVGIILIVIGAVATAVFAQKWRSTMNIAQATEAASAKAVETESVHLQNPDFIPVAMTAIGDITITPTKESGIGIAVNTEFLIKTKQQTSKEQLLSFLSVKSGETYRLEQTASSDTEFLLSFEQPLESDQIYRFEYKAPDKNPLSYAFQTEKGFGVMSTIPGKNGYSVPLHSGIEVTFNEKIEGEFANYFAIEPAVAGRFEQKGKTYTFIPNVLAGSTDYTVTIKGGLNSVSGNVMEEDYSFTFETLNDGQPDVTFFLDDMLHSTFLPSDGVFVQMYLSDHFIYNIFTVSIYQLETPQDYIGSYNEGRGEVTIPKDAALLETWDTELMIVGKEGYYGDQYYISLDKPLPAGYYIIDIKTMHDGKEYAVQKHIQSSDLSVYSLTVEGEEVFWVNDTTTKAPAANANINIDSATVKTDAQGRALVKTKGKGDAVVTVDYNGYPTFVYKTITYDMSERGVKEKYHSYLYTDRVNYKPNDTIDVFGALRLLYAKRLSGSDRLTLKLGDMEVIPVKLDEYGTFTAKIKVADMHDMVELSLCVNDEPVQYVYIYFWDYDKNTYIMSAETDRHTYLVGENAKVDVSLMTYDLAPVEGVAITNSDGGGTIVTQNDGIASTTVKIQEYPYSSNGTPAANSFRFVLDGQEDYYQSVYASTILLPSDILLEDERVSEDSIRLTASHINREAIENYFETTKDSYIYDVDLYRGAPAVVDFHMDVYKSTLVKEQIGEKYDFINKINVPQYKYDYVEEQVETKFGTTNGGTAIISGLPVSSSPDVYYYGEVFFTDTRGDNLHFNVSFGKERKLVSEEEYKAYDFDLLRGSDDSGYAYSLGLNETGTIRLKEYYDTNHYVTSGQMITILAGDKILDTAVGSAKGADVTFKKEYENNIYVFGAYFDGKYTYPVQYPKMIEYDYKERELNIEISADKEKYAPGAEVEAAVKVTDKDGKPRQAMVNLSVVDESALNQYSREVYFAYHYYNGAYLPSPRYYVYSSYDQYFFSLDGSSGAEQGGGGEEYLIREDFRDNPAFVSIQTDKNGAGTAVFTLGDAITSWRITANAITKDEYVGDETANIITTMPYYIDFVMPSEFVAGDEIGLLVKSRGEKYVRNQTEVLYEIEVLKGSEVVYTATSRSAAAVNFNAGKLSEGEYTVRVKAACGEYKDAMEEKITVLGSGIWLPLQTARTLSEETKELPSLEIMRSPVDLLISNGDMSLMLDVLYSCMSGSSVRTDYQAANAYGKYFLSNLRGDDDAVHYINSMKSNFRYDWGMRELGYGDKDPLYTARFAACFPEMVNLAYLKSYASDETGMYESEFSGSSRVTDEYDSDYDEMLRAAGYLTLASAGENVLLEIYDQIAIIKNSSEPEKFQDNFEQRLRVLYYAAALCTIGDDNGAKELIDRYAGSPVSGGGYSSDDMAYYTEFADTLMLYINTTVNPHEAYRYLETKKDNLYISDVLEKMNFIKKVIPLSGTATEVSYVLNGKTNMASLKNFDVVALNITREQFDKLQLTPLTGNSAVKVSFNGSVENLEERNRRITIEKDFQLKSPEVSESAYRVMFSITMPAEAKAGYYTVRDRIPSNMRYVYGERKPGEPYFYINHLEKQLVDMSFYYDGNSRNVSVYYDAAKVNDSDTVIPSAYISMERTLDGIWGRTE